MQSPRLALMLSAIAPLAPCGGGFAPPQTACPALPPFLSIMSLNTLVTVEHVVGIQQMAENIKAERQKNPNSYRRPLWQYVRLVPVYKFSQRTIESIIRGEYDGAAKSPAAGERPQGGGRVRPEVLSPQLIETADEVIDAMNNRDPPAPVSYMDAFREIHRLHPAVMAPVRRRARRSCPSA